MAVRKSEATWVGNLREGKGTMKIGKMVNDLPFTFASRFADGQGTNPEELVGAAHAGCFSMFLSSLLDKAGYTADRIHTSATVHLTEGPTISLIELHCEAKVPGCNDTIFQEQAKAAKTACPVSKALASVEIKLNAKLLP
jgi:osmotically inducible protein OsmC